MSQHSAASHQHISPPLDFTVSLHHTYLFSEALVFQLKKRPPDYVPRKGRKPDNRMGPPHGSLPPEKLPYLVELSPGDTRYNITPLEQKQSTLCAVKW